MCIRDSIYTEEINKVALSADDDKRIIMEDGISTLAYGHYNAPSRLKFDLEENNRIRLGNGGCG